MSRSYQSAVPHPDHANEFVRRAFRQIKEQFEFLTADRQALDTAISNLRTIATAAAANAGGSSSPSIDQPLPSGVESVQQPVQSAAELEAMLDVSIAAQNTLLTQLVERLEEQNRLLRQIRLGMSIQVEQDLAGEEDER